MDIEAPRRAFEEQKNYVNCLICSEPGKNLDRIVLEHTLQFVSDKSGIFEYRDMKNNRFYFTEKDETSMVYLGFLTRGTSFP